MKITSARLFLTAAIIVLFSGYLFAVSPTDEVIQRLKDEGRFDEFVQSMTDARARGVDSPGSTGITSAKGALSPQAPFRVLVILIDFNSMPYTAGWTAGTTDDFDSLLFSDGINPTGSMKEYYLENSYGSFVMQGDVAGWYRAAENHDYYTNFCDGSRGMGPYPNNAQRLVEEAVDAADPYVDFSLYDNDGNGYVDGIFVVHSGSGYEESGNTCQIHSHKWSISPRLRDGVYIQTYSIEPEESTGSQGLIPIGVFCHEFGHVLGLPDLYDTDYSSSGAGRWALMASGSYNGGSRKPSQFIAWSKMKLGWLNPVTPTANRIDAEIPAVEWNPVAYRLWRHGNIGSEYFIVENRQQVGFDEFIPGSGLLIWHIDDNVYGNSNEWHPQVFLEQADGRFHLQYGNGSGNAGDAYPGEGVPYFDDKTTPNSRDYASQATEAAVWDISPSDSVMTANLDVFWSRPYLYLTSYAFDDAAGGNGNGFLEQGETIEITITVSNDWKAVTSAEVTMTVDAAALTIVDGSVSLGMIGTNSSASNTGDPLMFSIPADYDARIDSFFFEIVTDGGEYTALLAVEQNVGKPSILLVDNDNGAEYEQYYSSPMHSVRVPYDVWDVSQSGTPGGGLLGEYPVIIWFVGDYRAGPLDGTATVSLQSYLDGGGNLFLSGQGIAEQLSAENPDFLNDYLKSTYLSSDLMPVLRVHESSPNFAGITGDISLQGSPGASNLTHPDRLAAVNGGSSELIYAVSTDLAAVSYVGAYRMMFFGFPMESIVSESSRFVERDTIFNRVLAFLNIDLTQGYPDVVATNVGPGDPTHLIEHTPQISWSYYDAGGAPQDSFQLQIGTDMDWAVAEAWDYGPNGGADTQVIYAGQPLIDGTTYYLRARVFNGTQWSNWQLDEFHMNSTPSAPSGLTPAGLAGVQSVNPGLQHQNADDFENDELTYGYQVYADSLLTDLIAQADGQLQGSGSSEWIVSAQLEEDSVYHWRVRAFDNYEYGSWSEAASFWVNADNQSPAAFELMAPSDGAFLTDLRPEFVWSSSGDPDRFDILHYSFVWSTDSNFASADTSAGLTDTVHTPSDSLPFGAVHYWMALAYDEFGGLAQSDKVFMYATWMPGDANGDSDVNVGDAVFVINFIFKGGAAPDPIRVGDTNQDCDVNVGDAVYLINYIFKTGPPPLIGCE